MGDPLTALDQECGAQAMLAQVILARRRRTPERQRDIEAYMASPEFRARAAEVAPVVGAGLALCRPPCSSGSPPCSGCRSTWRSAGSRRSTWARPHERRCISRRAARRRSRGCWRGHRGRTAGVPDRECAPSSASPARVVLRLTQQWLARLVLSGDRKVENQDDGIVMKLRRRIARLFRRQFDAAGASPRWPAAAVMASQPSAALAARPLLARKASYLAHNAPIAASIVDVWCTNLVGDGPSVRSWHPIPPCAARWRRRGGGFTSGPTSRAAIWFRVATVLSARSSSTANRSCGFLAVGRGELRLQISRRPRSTPASTASFPGGGAVVAGIERGANGECCAFGCCPRSPTRRCRP